MTRRFLLLPFGALTIFAAYLGLKYGQTPSETDIIESYAAAYIATTGEGAKRTDCLAVPHPEEAIRMVITCTHSSGVATTYFVGPRGQALPEPAGPSA